MARLTGSAVVIGDALIDEIRGDGGIRELVGGAALNVAVGMQRLGVSTTLIAMVGDDEAGSHIRGYLADHGVRLIACAAPLGSSRAIVTRTSGGEPTYTFNEAARRRSIRYSASAQQAILDADLVAVSCFPFDVRAEVDALANVLAGARVAIDPNPRAGMLSDRGAFLRGFEQIAARADFVKVGSDDATLLYDGDLAALSDRLRQLGVGAVLATAGAEGATIATDAGIITAPIAPLSGPIVDTVGAGDAALAAVAAALVAAPPRAIDDWRAVLAHAMGIAAATCRAEGGLLRTPESITAAAGGAHGS